MEIASFGMEKALNIKDFAIKESNWVVWVPQEYEDSEKFIGPMTEQQADEALSNKYYTTKHSVKLQLTYGGAPEPLEGTTQLDIGVTALIVHDIDNRKALGPFRNLMAMCRWISTYEDTNSEIRSLVEKGEVKTTWFSEKGHIQRMDVK